MSRKRSTVTLLALLLVVVTPLMSAFADGDCFPPKNDVDVSGDCEGASVATIGRESHRNKDWLYVFIDGVPMYWTWTWGGWKPAKYVAGGFNDSWSMEQLELDPCSEHVIEARWQGEQDSATFGGFMECCYKECDEVVRVEEPWPNVWNVDGLLECENETG